MMRSKSFKINIIASKDVSKRDLWKIARHVPTDVPLKISIGDGSDNADLVLFATCLKTIKPPQYFSVAEEANHHEIPVAHISIGTPTILGPIFAPSLSKGVCAACFFGRLAQNTILDHGTSIIPENYTRVWRLLHRELARLQSSESSRLLNCCAVCNSECTKYFPVVSLPLCDCNRYLDYRRTFHSRNSIAESLSSEGKNDKVVFRENGYRTSPPKVTYRRLKSLYGPLGCIKSLRKVNKVGPMPYYKVRRSPAVRLDEDGVVLTESSGRLSASGKGISIDQARCSAMSEAIERYSSQRPGHEGRLIRGAFSDLDAKAIDPRRFSSCSAQFNPEKNIEWIDGYSLPHKQEIYVPADLAFFWEYKEGKVFDMSSTGLASGNTLPEAILQALLEVVERDAFFISGKAQCPYPTVILQEKSDAKRIVSDIESATKSPVIVKDITTDVGIPTYIAMIASSSRRICAAGCGSHVSPSIASVRAITEAWQTYCHHRHLEATRGWKKPELMKELTEALYVDQHNGQHKTSYTRNDLHELLYLVTLKAFGYLLETKETRAATTTSERIKPSIAGTIERIVEKIVTAIPDTDVICVDLTHPTAGFPTARVLCPDLQDSEKTDKRSFMIPFKLGFADRILDREDLFNGYIPC